MTTKKVDFSRFALVLPEGWTNVTAGLAGNDVPFTIADPVKGIGALQLSIASYKEGPVPGMTLSDLQSMLAEFSQKHEFGPAFDQTCVTDDISAAASSFHSNGDFVRVWYVTDGQNIMLITYLCEWGRQNEELADAETIVRSVRFKPSRYK